MPAVKDSVIGRMNELMEELNGVKTASDKSATVLGLTGQGTKDPGGYEGPSSHPSARSASNTEKTPLGSRAKENETDIKGDHGPACVDNTDEGAGGSQESKQYNIGTTQSETGGQPSVEDNYKGTKDDKRQGDRGGTSGPYDAEDVGEKYSSMRSDDLSKLAYSKMNDVLADIANGVDVTSKSASISVNQAAKVGTALAGTEKHAVAAEILEYVVRDARFNADLTGEYLTKFAAEYAQLLKNAEGELVPPDGGGAGGPPGGMPPEGMGAPPPGAEGPPPGGEGGPGGPGGGGGPEQGLDEFISALLEMGATPEQIEQALQDVAGGGAGGPGGPEGGAGGPPPEAGGMPPGGPPPEMGGAEMGKTSSFRARGLTKEQNELFKVANVAKEHYRSGKFRIREPHNVKAAQERVELQKYILEVCNAR